MFKRFITVVTVFATSTFFLSGLTRAGVSIRTPKPVKERHSSCPTCIGADPNSSVDSLDGLATFGRRTQVMPFTPVQQSIFDGVVLNLVSSARGHLTFSIKDLEISGAMPISLTRVYASDKTQDTGLGAGWSFVFDDRITLGTGTARLSTGGGAIFDFRRDGQSFVLRTPGAAVHQGFVLVDENTIQESADGFSRTYKRLGSSYRLTRIADREGNAIAIEFNSRGNISRISNGGGDLILGWSDGRSPRLIAVTDNGKRKVGFKHDGSLLDAVTDAAGATWRYAYQAGRLTRAMDPLNRVLLRASYDKGGRVVETGDAAGASRYQYDFGSVGVSRETVITDPIGKKTTISHTALGAIASIVNDKGRDLVRIDYSRSNRPTRLAGPAGVEIRLSYDARDRLVRQSSTDKSFQEYTYDEAGEVSSLTTEAGRTDYIRDKAGHIVIAKSTDPAQSYLTMQNSRGQLTNVRSALGTEVSFEHDAAGNISAFATATSGRVGIDYDVAGNVTARRFSTGEVFRYEHDARGLISKQSDNNGRAVTIEREASGAIRGIATERGVWVRATRDNDGRIIALRSSSGKSRQFGYDARGALVSYVDALGKRKEMFYDQLGRLKTLADSDGRRLQVERDEGGQISAVRPERGNDGATLSGQYLAHPKVWGAGSSLLSNRGKFGTVAEASPQDSEFGCLFGGDGFVDPLTYTIVGYDCSDPFGMFGPFSGLTGDGSGFGDIDPFFGLQGGPFGCITCVTRQLTRCIYILRECNATIAQSTLYALGACAAILVAAGGPAALLCLGLDLSGAGMGGVGCDARYKACVLEAEDKCPNC